jgi:hypothetical protein
MGGSLSAEFFVSLAVLFKFGKFLVELVSERLFWLRVSCSDMASNLLDRLAHVFGKAIFASFLALCPRLDSIFLVIVACLEEGKIIIDAVGSLCIGLFFASCIIS